MKEGWEIRKLGDVATSHFNINWKQCEEQKEYVDLSSIDRGLHQITETQLIDKQNAPSRAQRIIKTNDILFATTRPTLRRFCIVPDNLNNQVCSSGLCVIRPKEKNVCSKWIYMLLLMDSFYKYIEPIQKGASYPAVVDSDVFSYPIPIPPLSEQQRIVSKLDSVFEKIDALKANAENNLKNAKDLFQQVLKKELEPKEGWKTMKLGDVCFVGSGSTPLKTNKDYWENGTIPWFTVDDIREQGRYIKYTQKHITELASKKTRVFPSYTVLLCCTASVGEYAITEIDTSSNQQFNGLTIKDKSLLNPYFLFYFAGTLKEQLLKLSGKTTIDFVASSKVKNIEISFPSLSEQQRIVFILDSLSEKCRRLEENYSKTVAECDALKQSILREVMSVE